jgi:23S rRNA (uracil1939-C5)-methyltransferase
LAVGTDGPIYAPFGLPGERVRARVLGERADILEVLEPSADRQAPPCAHFGACGGCSLQHWKEAAYLSWKRESLIAALAKRGLNPPVDPILAAWGQGRRRAGFHAMRTGKAVRFGFVERGAARIAAITGCPVLTPGLTAALPQLQALALVVAPVRGEAVLQTLETETGLDVDVRGAGKAGAFDRLGLERMAAAAAQAGLARLSFEGEPLVQSRVPMVRMGKARVAPPPGAFLQPTVAGEETLGALVVSALHGADRVADLFCGIGTFALRLAESAEVLAVETEAAMLAALKAAADGAGGALKAIDTLRRDLLRAPISALELKRIDAVVFDPPRSGARLQAEQIAASKASRVVAVSCDPATFARDARALVDGGFRFMKVTPVDQFRWSPHLEAVGVFER